MKIEEILSEMEAIILESPRVPFTNKRVIEEDDLAGVMDELRDALPNELTDAKRIIADRQRLLDDAQHEAKNIVEQAQTYAAKLVDEDVITRQAQEQANEFVQQANNSAEKLRNDSIRYAEDVFEHLESSIGCLTDAVRQSHQSLKGNS